MQTPAVAATAPLIAPRGTSLGAQLTKLQPAVYQDFVDRGWRRLNAWEYRPYRDHRRTVNAWNKFVLGQEYPHKAARLCPRTREKKRLISIASSREKKWRKNHFDLRMGVHEAESQCVTRPVDPRSGKAIAPAHEFEVNLEPDTYSEEKYVLFENYQRQVHKESQGEISKHGFKRFLCSGMGQSSRLKDGVEQKLGSYHQCYRLDGRLVAIGVLDLLPSCVSSVYLILFTDIAAGFYVHSCIKMRYKSQYQPSEILGDWLCTDSLACLSRLTFVIDLETYTWNLLDADHLARLSARNYVSMFLERQLHLPPHKMTRLDEVGLDEGSLSRLRNYRREWDPSRNSALDAGMPGLMSLDEIGQRLELGKWLFKCGDMLAHLEVSRQSRCDFMRGMDAGSKELDQLGYQRSSVD
ncbi:MAG: hypothetical protein Q9210_001517 [Variospora velana]